ncbi:unnamed protein product [Parnassius apollo]|uniref:(apollo) hypothetical protein n=1 Tax=Parnassius apollo TaxID=110799 RepID=A0A8S3X272_PARAO|nr:unnamed protein product [Parnassius apollo]
MTLMMFSTFQELREHPKAVPVCGSHYRFTNSGVGVDSTTWFVLLQVAVESDAAQLYHCKIVQQYSVKN